VGKECEEMGGSVIAAAANKFRRVIFACGGQRHGRIYFILREHLTHRVCSRGPRDALISYSAPAARKLPTALHTICPFSAFYFGTQKYTFIHNHELKEKYIKQFDLRFSKKNKF
jgi:hypothetical protein